MTDDQILDMALQCMKKDEQLINRLISEINELKLEKVALANEVLELSAELGEVSEIKLSLLIDCVELANLLQKVMEASEHCEHKYTGEFSPWLAARKFLDEAWHDDQQES